MVCFVKPRASTWQKAKDAGILTQVECFADLNPQPDYQFIDFPANRSWCLGFFNIDDDPVSYTHLTLPTILLV
eukprot:3415990-Amphidinium_carterae.1